MTFVARSEYGAIDGRHAQSVERQRIVFNGMRGRNNSIFYRRRRQPGWAGPAATRVAVGLEMIQEFRVSATSISAELGGAAGGLVNVVTHTGQNLWHGDVTFFHQNEKLNARNPEVETAEERPRYRKYQPGTSVGEPDPARSHLLLHGGGAIVGVGAGVVGRAASFRGGDR